MTFQFLLNQNNKESKGKDSTITTQILKYIILEYYHCQKPYSLELFQYRLRQNIIARINNENNIVRNANRPVLVNQVNCYDCGLEIMSHSLIVFNKHSNARQRRRYHFRCALKKKLVELKDENIDMHEDYRKFMLGILI